MNCVQTCIKTNDFDMLSEWERSIGMDIERKQLSRGRRSIQGHLVTIGELLLWRYSGQPKLLIDFAIPQGYVELLLGVFADPLIWCGKTFANKPVAALNFGGREIRTITPAEGVAYGFMMPESLAQNSGFLDELPRADATIPEKLTATIDETLIADDLASIDAFFDRPSQPTLSQRLEVYEQTLSFCIKVVDTCFPVANPSLGHAAHERVVKNAQEVLSCVDLNLVKSSDLAERVGVNRRTLERAFRSQLQISPYQYMLIQRLHQARHSLKCGSQPIGDICLQHGFEDQSRFTQQYRRHFGELPSQTKSRLRHV